MATGAGMVAGRPGFCAASLEKLAILLQATIDNKDNNPNDPIIFTPPPFTALA